MNLEQVLNTLACLALMAFGAYAMAQPRAAAQLAGLGAVNPKGVAEIRITFGMLSLALGAVPLLLNQQAAYQTVGLVFLAALLMRIAAAGLDRLRLDRGYLISGLFELVVGLTLFLA
ncbi:MAG: hypothetical protein K8I30_18985 [Anaerolineae bacterium]|nr:hypothetical protein [Anaerolineae bacterium]